MQQYDKYKNDDGTYLSPKNNKVYKSLTAFIAHWYNPGTGGFDNSTKKNCEFCNELYTVPNLKKHENACWLNPVNIKECANCSKPIKDYKNSKGTCSRSCANTAFKSGVNNGNYKGETYRHICFDSHEKKCIICGEDKIVAVHHYNENHFDDRPENLIPLCPTHHQYMHSKYRIEIEDKVKEYINKFSLK